MKERGGILERPIPDLGKLGDRICTKDNQLLSKEAGMAGTTLVHNRDSLLPLKPKSRVAVISLSNFEDGRLYFLEPRCLGSLLAAIHDGQVQAVHCGKLTEEHPHEFGAAQRALDAARQADVVVVAAFIKVVVNRGTVNLDEPVIEFLNQLRNLGKPVVIVSLGSPYLIKQVPWAGAFVCAFAPSEGCQAAVAELLCGRAEFRGTMPVELHWQ
jgi:beta-N-acetylhexosaminidase